MYAIVKDRGHQYKVREGERVRVELLDAEAGAPVTFDPARTVMTLAVRSGLPHSPSVRIFPRPIARLSP